VSAELVLLAPVAYHGREITGPRLRGLLALLAGDLRAGCGTGRLVDGLWPDEQPDNPTKAVQVLVSRARAQLGSEVIASTPTGYRLALSEDQVDSSMVLLSASASARASRSGDHEAALAHAEAGLACWQSAPAADAALDDPVAMLRAERATTYRSLVRARALALSRLGRHAEAVEALTVLARERPRDEEVLLELLRAEAATAGPSAALARYDGYRRSLRAELGSDPGPALQAGYQQLLQGTAPAVRHGVPHEPNPLLGRDDDIAAVANLVRTSRVTSIVGPGGLGKTRLAYVVSRQAEQRVVHLVALAGVTTDDDVAGEVASAVGAGDSRRAAAESDPVAGIAGALGPGPTLLVLDNCEHVLAGVAELVRALVSMTGDLRVLTTSRAPLGLSSESVYPLPELSLPTMVELFTQRARAARPGVDLPPAVVEELCRRLDGLPLAVELAAARVRLMSVAEIAGRLADRFTLLRGGPRDAPQRHRTLHAVVDWSWNLLDPAGQAAMRALSVFPGGFTVDAARHVLDRGDDDQVLSVLEHLVDQSLLKVVDSASGSRLRMLETVREFSTVGPVSDAFLAWARDFGRAHHEALFGPDPYQVVAAIRDEQDNLLYAFRHALARSDAATVAAVTAVLGGLYYVESNYTRMATLAEEGGWLLSHFRPGADLVEVTRTALTLCATYTFVLVGPRAVRPLVALRRLPPAPPDTLVRAAVRVLGAADRAALHEMCDSPEPLVVAVANSIASYFWEADGDLDNALKAANRMLEAVEHRGAAWARMLAHGRISELCLQLEQPDLARRHLLAALPGYERFGAWSDVAGVRWWLVLANLQLGAVEEAEQWLEQVVPDRPDEPVSVFTYGLGVRAEILLARGEVDAGLRLWRRVVDRLKDPEDANIPEPGMNPWILEAKAIAVVAHAYEGRADLVEEVVAEIARRLPEMLANPVPNPPPYLMERQICGALLLALAVVDLDLGRRTGDDRAARSGARLVALAERFHFLRAFQPTMAAARAQRAARQADGPAYDEAVSSYADLGGEEMAAVALSALRERPSGSFRPGG
jgi:predicted ATPase/DNA-binding SARP family transcriptional activator